MYGDYDNYAKRMGFAPLTDQVITDAFEGTNFGRTDFREMLHGAVLKVACGWHNGHTITQIMISLGLITPKKHTLTKKGQLVIWAAYGKKVTV